jgi:NitT/TauT family transport system ATP-binding protein
MQNVLLDVWYNSGASVLFVTNSFGKAAAFADSVVVYVTTGRGGDYQAGDISCPRTFLVRPMLLRDEVDGACVKQETFTAAE